MPVSHVKIPKKVKQRLILDKLAKLVSVHGLEAEKDLEDQTIRGRIKDATLKQLFVDCDADLVAYYKWRTYSFYNGDSKRTWSQLPYQVVE